MKLFKLLSLVPLIIIFSEVYFFKHRPMPSTKDTFSNEEKNQQLISLLNIAHINTYQLKFKEFNQEMEFITKNSNNQPVVVYLSLQKDPTVQVNALQKLLKMANINQDRVKLVDLAGIKPYATF